MVHRHAFTVVWLVLVMALVAGTTVVHARETRFTRELNDSTGVQAEIEPTVNLRAIAGAVIYPELARRMGLEGKAVARVLIDKRGQATTLEILYSTDTLFDQPAIDAIRKAGQFTPGLIHGQPIDTWVAIPIVFRLRNNTRPHFVQPSEALLALLTKAVDGAGNNEQATAFYNRGLALYYYDDATRAYQDYRRSAKLDTAAHRPFYDKAGLTEVTAIADVLEEEAPDLTGYGILVLEHSADTALDYARKALEKNREYAPAWFLQALAYKRRGDYDKALLSCKRAFSLDLQNPDYTALLGRLFYDTGNYSAARACCVEALSLNPNIAEAAYTKAVIALRLSERFSKTQEEFQTTDKKFASHTQLRQQAIDDLRTLVQERVNADEAQHILRDVFHVE